MYKPQILSSGCKINLFLRILKRRPDGYHELDTLFYPLARPADILDIRPTVGLPEIVIECNEKFLEGPRNILHSAYALFGQKTGRTLPRLVIRLQKKIPVGAGLGGGSANAASLLRYLNAPEPIDDYLLQEIAASLGADVPFFLQDMPAEAGGIGDLLRPTRICLPKGNLLLVMPDIPISTSWAYGQWDAFHLGCRTAKGQERQILTSTDGEAKDTQFRYGAIWVNDFEHVVFPEYTTLWKLKMQLLALGAAACVMSGSGSSMFALFIDDDALERALKHIKRTSFEHHVYQV
jgi:4-diphosphocytidyl-2-C-methyl-D-erythritol kinase